MTKKWIWVLALVALFVVAHSAFAAAPTCSANESWQVPEQGAVELFRTADRTFAVGAESGGAHVPPRPGGERYPKPVGCGTYAGQCIMSGCYGACISYPGYYCDPCSCGKFDFC